MGCCFGCRFEIGNHVGGQTPGLTIELDIDEANVALGRDRTTLLRKRIASTSDVIDCFGGGDDLVHSRLVLRIRQFTIGVEDDRGRVASARWELLLQQVGRLLCVRVWNREVVLQLATDRAGGSKNASDNQHPDTDRTPRVSGDGAGQTGEKAGLAGWRSDGHRGILRGTSVHGDIPLTTQTVPYISCVGLHSRRFLRPAHHRPWSVSGSVPLCNGAPASESPSSSTIRC